MSATSQSGLEEDCNGNGVPDSCDLVDDPSLDCDGDGIFDSCAINDGLVEDCNGNSVPDSCDLAGDPSLDCDGDGIFDSCAINDGLVVDCNGNNIPDSCEIDDGTALDCNGNGVPDSCEIITIDFEYEYKVMPIQDIPNYAYKLFGRSVSVSQEFAVVGAPETLRQVDVGIVGTGSANILKFDDDLWIEGTVLLATDGADGDHFGESVSISGDTIVVGAYGDDDNGQDSGSAYIYRFDGSDWNFETKLLASDGVQW